MSKYHLKCSCINCHTETTVQSLKAHINKCTKLPKHKCINCNADTNNLKFCSHSCRAIFTNTRRIKKIPSLPINTFEKTLIRFYAGKISERHTLRKCLAHTQGYKCVICNVDSWNNQKITLIVDHIDGNAGNAGHNFPINLQLLCPNCNSQSPTFSGRNKGNGRKSRGLPLN